MNRLLSHYSASIFLRYKSSLFSRSKYNFSDTIKSNIKLPNSNMKKGGNKHLFNKIWSTKDSKFKQKIMFSKVNKFNGTLVSFTKFQMSNNEKIMNRTLTTNGKVAGPISFQKCNDITDKSTAKTERKSSDVRKLMRKEPGEVIWGFIPKEWHSLFVPITGYSGFYTLLFTLSTSLLSKEIFVCDHEYYNGISVVILCIYGVKTQGPIVAKMLDKGIDNYERELNTWKEKMKQKIRDSILSEIKYQECIEGQQILIEAKRENVHLQREAEFRKRQMDVYENVTRILKYHVECEKVRRSIQQKNLIQWVTKEVEKNLTPELKEKYMKLCMADIKEIFRRNQK
ncbi:ATP synthase subunit b, mitochondrial-like [Harmonia axyridis]|uniref:ATP synthase subunit b, mitochondrial-like n=1 Tax=Harmonia axyridis TaxID=115357 RepID=UPI001E2768A8|nr:ATP synthase subunit b, mitochondrial-like [Harmonia axyridis]